MRCNGDPNTSSLKLTPPSKEMEWSGSAGSVFLVPRQSNFMTSGDFCYNCTVAYNRLNGAYCHMANYRFMRVDQQYLSGIPQIIVFNICNLKGENES